MCNNKDVKSCCQAFFSKLFTFFFDKYKILRFQPVFAYFKLSMKVSFFYLIKIRRDERIITATNDNLPLDLSSKSNSCFNMFAQH